MALFVGLFIIRVIKVAVVWLLVEAAPVFMFAGTRFDRIAHSFGLVIVSSTCSIRAACGGCGCPDGGGTSGRCH